MTALPDIQAGWDQAAREDAMGNILSIPGLTHDEFMQKGRDEIAHVLKDVESRGLKHDREFALDFGCGIGRLSVALADHFTLVSGIDISGEMIKRAIPHEGVFYERRDTLEHLLGPFDFIYSNIVLQHMPTDCQEGYVKAFVRLLADNGVAVFEIPDGPDHRNGHLSMYSTPPDTVREWVTSAGARVVAVTLTDSAGPAITSYRYTVTR